MATLAPDECQATTDAPPAVDEASADAKLAAIPRPLILFDGDCGFCNKSIQYILKRDKAKQFHFAALESEVGKAALRQAGLPKDYKKSLVLLDDAGTHVKSTGVARIAARLDGISKAGSWVRIIPRPLRDFGYDLVARYRYLLAGNGNVATTCSLLPDEDRKRFVF